jgi:hypothetical protein
MEVILSRLLQPHAECAAIMHLGESFVDDDAW